MPKQIELNPQSHLIEISTPNTDSLLVPISQTRYNPKVGGYIIRLVEPDDCQSEKPSIESNIHRLRKIVLLPNKHLILKPVPKEGLDYYPLTGRLHNFYMSILEAGPGQNVDGVIYPAQPMEDLDSEFIRGIQTRRLVPIIDLNMEHAPSTKSPYMATEQGLDLGVTNFIYNPRDVRSLRRYWRFLSENSKSNIRVLVDSQLIDKTPGLGISSPEMNSVVGSNRWHYIVPSGIPSCVASSQDVDKG